MQERADLKDRCPKCHRYHSIDIAIGELCQRIEEAEGLLRRVALGYKRSILPEIQHYFDTYHKGRS